MALARIDRARLDAAAAGILLDVPTRFDDLDTQGHVNNVAAVAILQEARAHFNMTSDVGGRRAGLRVLVAALAVEYAGELHHPGVVTIRTGVMAIGRSSVTLGQIARQDGVPKLYAEAVIVLADERGPAAIPDPLRAAYARHLIAGGAA